MIIETFVNQIVYSSTPKMVVPFGQKIRLSICFDYLRSISKRYQDLHSKDYHYYIGTDKVTLDELRFNSVKKKDELHHRKHKHENVSDIESEIIELDGKIISQLGKVYSDKILFDGLKAFDNLIKRTIIRLISIEEIYSVCQQLNLENYQIFIDELEKMRKLKRLSQPNTK